MMRQEHGDDINDWRLFRIDLDLCRYPSNLSEKN